MSEDGGKLEELKHSPAIAEIVKELKNANDKKASDRQKLESIISLLKGGGLSLSQIQAQMSEAQDLIGSNPELRNLISNLYSAISEAIQNAVIYYPEKNEQALIDPNEDNKRKEEEEKLRYDLLDSIENIKNLFGDNKVINEGLEQYAEDREKFDKIERTPPDKASREAIRKEVKLHQEDDKYIDKTAEKYARTLKAMFHELHEYMEEHKNHLDDPEHGHEHKKVINEMNEAVQICEKQFTETLAKHMSLKEASMKVEKMAGKMEKEDLEEVQEHHKEQTLEQTHLPKAKNKFQAVFDDLNKQGSGKTEPDKMSHVDRLNKNRDKGRDDGPER